TSASSTMRRASAGSIRKCCPSDFFGRIPRLAARARTRLGVREGRAAGSSRLPADLDVRHALAEGRDLRERGGAAVDDPSGDAVGATVVDYHSDRLAVIQI